MAAPPTAPPMEMSKPVPGQGSAPPFEPAKPYPYPYPGQAQDTEAGVRGHGYDRLPCCGLGIGWVLFITGFLFTIPWYVGAVLLCFYREEKREKPGFIACTVGAVILTILIIVVAILDAVLVHD
ncbi:hypothetical protein QYE76_051818 [Lolium multiflorum]|uniref:60S ribosomal protein L18a-like protein n=1 Tax=Lolium multiflorum TaxID=4521 RepID=A0AAD8STS0_LOLMU|nr:hypothetical protein QYE76_051818 [Lolium multiflorum]